MYLFNYTCNMATQFVKFWFQLTIHNWYISLFHINLKKLFTMLLGKTPSKIKRNWPVYASKYPPVYTHVYMYLLTTNL